jgi:hypothetical protein
VTVGTPGDDEAAQVEPVCIRSDDIGAECVNSVSSCEVYIASSPGVNTRSSPLMDPQRELRSCGACESNTDIRL